MRICLLIASFLLACASAGATQETESKIANFVNFVLAIGLFYLALVFVATGIIVAVGG